MYLFGLHPEKKNVFEKRDEIVERTDGIIKEHISFNFNAFLIFNSIQFAFTLLALLEKIKSKFFFACL